MDSLIVLVNVFNPSFLFFFSVFSELLPRGG